MGILGTRVRVPIEACNAFDFPKICLVTGSRKDVTWKRTRSRFHPPWVWLLLPLGVIPALIAAAAVEKNAVVEFPYVSRAWWLGQGARAVSALLGLSMVVGVIFALVAFFDDQVVLAGLLGAVSLVVPIAWWLFALPRLSVAIPKMTDRWLELRVRHPAVIEALRQRFDQEVI